MRGKNKLDAAFSLSQENGGKYYAGPTLIDLDVSRTSVGLFGALGLTDHIDLVASVPLVNFKPQDAALFIKLGTHNIKIKSVRLSLIGAVGASAPMTNYRTETTSAIGQRATQVQPRFVTQLTGSKTFINLRGGYNAALTPVRSSYLYSAKVGYFKNKAYADLWFEIQTAIGGKDYQGVDNLATDTGADRFRDLGVSYMRVGGVYYSQWKEKIGLFIGGGYTLGGRNTFISWRASVGVVAKLDMKKKETPAEG